MCPKNQLILFIKQKVVFSTVTFLMCCIPIHNTHLSKPKCVDLLGGFMTLNPKPTDNSNRCNSNEVNIQLYVIVLVIRSLATKVQQLYPLVRSGAYILNG